MNQSANKDLQGQDLIGEEDGHVYGTATDSKSSYHKTDWNGFKKVFDEKLRRNVAQCLTCFAIIKNTTRTKSHRWTCIVGKAVEDETESNVEGDVPERKRKRISHKVKQQSDPTHWVDELPEEDAFAENESDLHKLINDNFLQLHKKIQRLEVNNRKLHEQYERNEQRRQKEHKSIMNRLIKLENCLSTGGVSAGPQDRQRKRIKKIRYDETVDEPPTRDESNDEDSDWELPTADDRNGVNFDESANDKLVMEMLNSGLGMFPFRTVEAMEQVASYALRTKEFRAELMDILKLGSKAKQKSLEEWISADVFSEFNLKGKVYKRKYSSSMFMMLIREAWVTKEFTMDMFTSILDEVRIKCAGRLSSRNYRNRKIS